MSDWQVHLECEEGTSSKFWRARVEGGTLYVNYGKIGTTGQTQVKELGPDGARKELDKLVREKRKKGYVDAGTGGGGGGAADEGGEEEGDEDEDEDEAPRPKAKPAKAAPAAAAPPAAPPAARAAVTARLRLSRGGRDVTTTLTLDGATVRLDALETYATPDAARAAFERLRAAMAAEGHGDT